MNDQLTEIITRMKDYERRLHAMESFNQVNVIKLGEGANQITLDGNQGKIFVGDSNFVIDGAGQKIQVSRSGVPIDVIDAYGLISNSNMTSSFASTTVGLNQGIATNQATDITGMSFTVSPFRTVRILLIGQVTGWIYNAGAGDFAGNGVMQIARDNTQQCRAVSADKTFFTVPLHVLQSVNAGTYEYKLRAWCDSTTGTAGIRIYQAVFSYFIVGN